MHDQLQRLLDEHDILYGVLCRDPTLIQLELMALAGYHLVWLDLEHCSLTNDDAVRLGRTIAHLGMVSLVRIPELARTHVQVLLDGGINIVNLPDVRSAAQVSQFVQLGKYPPLGQRGVSSTTANLDYSLTNTEQAFRAANAATRLMVLIESDQGFDALDAILNVEGLDMISVGPGDWAAQSGLHGEQAKRELAPKIEHVFRAAAEAGKLTVHMVADAEGVRRCRDWGVRIMLAGVDINMHRKALTESLQKLQAVRTT